MYVVGCLEKAAAHCIVSVSNEEQVADWDKAVALYTGSEARASGNGGHFVYSLAQVECTKFGTCKKGDLAPANANIFDLFVNGKEHLLKGNCADAKEHAAKIKALMTIPLAQGVLRTMYALDLQDDFQETTQGQGAAFAAAILPLVNKCNKGNADIIHNDLAPGEARSGSYEVVKAAFERSYDCLGITCKDVGGLINLRGDGYLVGAEACDNVQPVQIDVHYDDETIFLNNDNSENYVNPPLAKSPFDVNNVSGVSTNVSLALGLTFGIFGFVVGAIVTVVCMNRKHQRSEKQFDTTDTAIISPKASAESKSDNAEII